MTEPIEQPVPNGQMYLEPEGIDLVHYMYALWRRKWLILGIAIIVLAVAAFRTFRVTPVYQASATLMIEQSSRLDVVGDFTPSWYYRDTHVANRMMLLASRQVKSRIIESFPDSLLSYLTVITADDTITYTPGQILGIAGFGAQPVKDTDMIRLSVATVSPRLAVILTNLYADVYEKYDLEMSRKDVSSVRGFIEEQLNVVGRRLDIAEMGLQQFKKEKRFVNLSAETQALISRQSNLAVALAQAETELEGIQAQFTHVKSMIDKEGEGMTGKLENIASPLVASFKATLDHLEVDRANLLMQGYPDTSDHMQKLNAQISEVRSKLAQESQKLLEGEGFIEPVGRLKELWNLALELEIDLTTLTARKRILEAAALDHRAKLRRLPEVERTYAKLTRDVETDRQVYAMLSSRYEEARIQEAGKISSVRIVDRAQYAGKIKPQRRKDLSMGLVVALVLALGVAFAVEYFDSSLRTPDDLERRGYPILGTIPILPKESRWKKNPITSHLMTHAKPSSSGAEAFRVLRTNMLFASATRPFSTILVTSSEPNEGKSTVAVNLAVSLAQAGHKTLLVDADLRAPVLHSVFERARKPGFTDLVVFKSEIEEAIFQTQIDGLSCIASGTIPPSPADVLSSSHTDEVFQELREQFDYIVFDTPPVLLAADTAVLASKVDAIAFVVRAGKTPDKAVETAMKLLAQTGGMFLGTVLNGLKPEGHYGKYYYYYSAYSYKYRYSRRRKRLSEAEEEGGESRI